MYVFVNKPDVPAPSCLSVCFACTLHRSLLFLCLTRPETMALHKKTTFWIAFVINALLIAPGEANATGGVLEKSDTFRSARVCSSVCYRAKNWRRNKAGFSLLVKDSLRLREVRFSITGLGHRVKWGSYYKRCELHIGTCLGVCVAESVNNLDSEYEEEGMSLQIRRWVYDIFKYKMGTSRRSSFGKGIWAVFTLVINSVHRPRHV